MSELPGSSAAWIGYILRPMNLATNPEFQPRFFRLHDPAQAQAFATLRAELPHLAVHDEIDGQLDELLKSRNPRRKLGKDDLAALVQAHLGGRPRGEYGVWVHYPWAQRVVHLLDEEEFVFLRTSRNIYKITPAEQALLGRKKVGVIGLSVGQSISMTLAMERSFGEIRLADFDRLELTNLNRIRTGVHNLNVPKAIAVAREIAELDPFLRVVVFGDGITDANLDEFFLGGGKLDAVVDECDGLDIKALARTKAKQLGVPVIMDASDRGTLDIERFDLEPDRPLLHGWLAGLDVDKLKTLKTSEEKVPYIMAFAQLDTLSSRMKASMVEIEQTVTTWPQLASAVVLGGGLGADVYRRMMLDQLHASGRWFIDLEELIADAKPAAGPIVLPPIAPPHSPAALAETARGLDLVARPGQITPARETIEKLVEAAVLAPSGANFQPWLWWNAGGTLVLFHDDRFSDGYATVHHNFDHLGLGAALENLTLAAHACALEVGIEVFPDPAAPRVAAIARFFARGATAQGVEPGTHDHLVEEIATRATDRRLVARTPIDPARLAELVASVEHDGDAHLRLVTDPAALDEAAAIIGAADRVRMLNPHAHADFYQRELRWTAEEAKRTGDGVDLETIDLTVADRMGFKVAADPRVVAHLAAWGGGGAFEKLGQKAVASASAIGVLALPSFDPRACLRAGRLTERMWLTASRAGLGLQPLMAAIMHFHRVDHAGGSGMSEPAQHETRALRARFDALFGFAGDKSPSVPMFLFRLVVAPGRPLRSYRRALGDLLHHDG